MAPVLYVPRRWASPAHQSFRRWQAWVLHRRAGKTTAALLHHQRAATSDDWERRRLQYLARAGGFTLSASDLKDLMRNRRYGHVLPTRTQAKMVAWEDLKYWSRAITGARINESELRVDYPGGHRVTLFGADKPDSFRGGKFSGISFDEFGMMRPNVFSEVVSKSLADHLGYAIFLGTIKGRNQLYTTYEAAKDDDEWLTIWQDIDKSLRTETGATITMLRQAMTDDKKLIARGLMSEEEFQQEWYLSPEAAIRGSIFGKQLADMRKDKRIRRVPYDSQFPVYDVWDLGKGPNMSVGMYQRIGREFRMIDYYEGADSDGIPQVIAALQRKPYVWGKHFAPHDIMGTDLSTGKTRQKTAEALGWKFEVVPSLSVVERINAGRLVFGRSWIDEQHCAPFLKAIPFYRRPWDDKLQTFRDDPVHDWASHPADQWTYAAVVEDKMTNERTRPKPTPGRSPAGRNAALAWMGG